MKPHPHPLCPESCDTVGRTSVLKGWFSRARDGYAGQRPCRLVLFSTEEYQSIEVGAVFADKIYDVFQPRMAGVNTLTDEQQTALIADLKEMGVEYEPS